jgi:hypothetical protein
MEGGNMQYQTNIGNQPQVTEWLRCLDEAIARLQGVCGQFEQKLQPVLIEAVPMEPFGFSSDRQLVPVADDLRCFVHRVDALSEWMEAVRGRIEL